MTSFKSFNVASGDLFPKASKCKINKTSIFTRVEFINVNYKIELIKIIFAVILSVYALIDSAINCSYLKVQKYFSVEI